MSAEARPDLWPLPARGTPVSPVWRSAGFEAEMGRWCADALGSEVRLEVVKVRCWSAVWRVRSDVGTFYAKQNCPGQAFEARLMQALGRLTDRVVPVVAVDLDRGFLMTPDQGPVLGETVGEVGSGDPEDELEAWCAVAREGALLQRDLARHVDDLAEAGVTRLGAADAATYVATRLEQYAALPLEDPRRLDEHAAARLRATLPELDRWVGTTLALGLPVTLNHSDLHQNNVFATAGGMRFFDFGDALLTDPLSVLLVTLNVLKHRYECAADDGRLARVADAALEVWSDLAPTTALRAGLAASLQLGKLARSESWSRCLGNVTDDELAEFGDSATYWLADLAEPPPYASPSLGW